MSGALAKLSGPKLEALIERLGEVERQATRAAIAAGLGNVRFSELAAVADADDRPHNRAARASLNASLARMAASDELAARRRYHGGRGPIRTKE